MMQILANALTSAPRAMFCFCSPLNAVMQKSQPRFHLWAG